MAKKKTKKKNGFNAKEEIKVFKKIYKAAIKEDIKLLKELAKH